jgi:hypothetical protein
MLEMKVAYQVVENGQLKVAAAWVGNSFPARYRVIETLKLHEFLPCIMEFSNEYILC